MANGKWSHLKDSLPKFQQPSEWQQRVDAIRGELADSPNAELARRIYEARRRKQELEEEITAENAAIEAASQTLLDRMGAENLHSFKTDEGLTVYESVEPYASVTDKSELNAWLRENGFAEALTIHHKTLTGIVKERLVNGENAPPGVAVYVKSEARVRSGG